MLLRWFYRFSAAYFVLTALTAVPLYFRKGGARPGLYSDEVKDWLVMLHNGEWISYLIFENPFWSGLVIGSILSLVLLRSALRALARA